MTRCLLAAIAVAAAGLLPVVSTAQQAPRADVPLGLNLAPVNDWSTQQPFIDVMKTARPWIGHKPGQWGGVDHEALAARGILDENGWPTEIPHDLGSIGTLILTDLPEDADIYAGRYLLTFRGDGIVEVGGSAENVRYGDGQLRFDFTPGGGFVGLRIQRSDRRGTGDYLRDISVVKMEHAEAWRRGKHFNPHWLERMRGVSVLRFMDWMDTNNSKQGRWQDRPRPDDYTYAEKGVPAEVMVALANELGADAWFCMPHLADDDYIRRFAETVKARLDRPNRVYVEYSNEVWNWMFDQTKWADTRAEARWGKEHKGVQFYGMRAAQVARLWAEVFGDVRDRLTTVVATHTRWLGLETQILDAPLWVNEAPEQNAPPAQAFDAYAVTGYFGHPLGKPERRDMLARWLAESRAAARATGQAQGLSGAALEEHVARHRYDAAVEKATEELADGRHSGQVDGTLSNLLDHIQPHHAQVARDRGLELIMYEGGTHVLGHGPVTNDEEITAFFTHLNYTPQMAQLYRRLVAGWAETGGGLFTAFNDVMKPIKWGSWGHLRHLGDDNPRWRAIQTLKDPALQ
ncbi:hypothetical protein [Roseovarius salinarum]|uniref:hypothetical protein n=1 Tax=Roseovarius salinarum TaxID=1981892 RepID=UPI001E4B40F7|nr:hypothetical protein [Roseovarius salinarum]